MIQTIKEIALFAALLALCAFIWVTAYKVTDRYFERPPAPVFVQPEIVQPVIKVDQFQKGNTLVTICTDTSKGQVVPCTTIFLPL
jgi:hypothetical protein